MDAPYIIERERWGVPDPPNVHRYCHHCDTFRGFERTCGCTVCSRCAAECFDCGQSFCLEHTYEVDGDDEQRVRICFDCQSARNYFEAQEEIFEERKAG